MLSLSEILNYAIAFFTLFTTFFFIFLYIENRKECLKKSPSPKKYPTVSIVMPAHNEEKYIKKAIESLLNCDYPKEKMEIIVVDDGSTDRTYEIATSFKDERLKVYRIKKGGKGKALNYGIRKARGEFIATMDADSYIMPKTLKELIALFDEEEVMAVTPAVKIPPSKNWLKEFQRVEYMMILFSRKLLSFIDSVPVTPGPFSMFKREVFEKVGLFDENNLVEDQEIALRIQSHNFKIKSSLTADVYTQPPETLGALLRQRVRWQRGGIRNYWKYKFMISPKFGDFGLYFIPLNFLSLAAFFLILALMIEAFINQPYYSKYILMEIMGLNIGLYTLVGAFVILVSIYFTYLAVKAFPNEKVKARYIILFIFFYWYLMLGYNTLFLIKELTRGKAEW